MILGGRKIAAGTVLAGAFLLAVGVGTAWYLFHVPDRSGPEIEPPPSTDPRTIYDGPFRNIRPDIETVGSARCAPCHPDIAKTYARHPMGRSIVPAADLPVSELASGGRASFTALGSQFRIERTGGSLRYTETRSTDGGAPLYETTTEVGYVVGSGSKGHSFLCERDGFITQAPVSWFAQKRVWDLSPGFPPDLHAGRPIQAGCLLCHANEVVPVAGTENRYQRPVFRVGSAIGCERCHGPGAEHVRLREAGGTRAATDFTIVNPAHLAPALREAVCQQCHLEGEVRVTRVGRTPSEFRPGLPLDAFTRVLVRDHRGADRKAVNHVEQMYLSKCFSASNGAMGCTTCHDPHDKPEAEVRTARYRNICLKCHTCSASIAVRTANGAADNCASCHMPRFEAGDIPHAASTDHRISRPAARPGPGETPGPASQRPLIFFPARQPDFRNPDEGRDFAVGLVDLVRHGRSPPGDTGRDALPLLERAIAAAPADARAWEAKSYALQYGGRKSEALAAAATALSLAPDSEAGSTHAAALAFELGHLDRARDYWRKAVALNPANASYRQELAAVLAKGGDWPAALAEAAEAVRLDPAYGFARAILAVALCRAGNEIEGEAAFRTVEALKPPNLAELRRWYLAERGRQ